VLSGRRFGGNRSKVKNGAFVAGELMPETKLKKSLKTRTGR
jgi:hypothetical protein